MAATHAPGTGLGPGHAPKHWRRVALLAGAVVACAAIVLPIGLNGLHDRRADASPTAPVTHARTVPAGLHPNQVGPLGARNDLPRLLPPASPTLQDGEQVQVGNVTDGVLRRTPAAGWRILVQWNGSLQPVTTRGPVTLDQASWVSPSGQIYTRVPTGTPGRFRVYGWFPEGGNAFAPPTLVAGEIGPVCFDRSFTAYGDCRRH